MVAMASADQIVDRDVRGRLQGRQVRDSHHYRLGRGADKLRCRCAGQDARSPEQDGPTVKLPIAEVPVSLLKASIAVRALPVCNVGMGSAAATQPILE
jgi:hypothetical protein